MNKKEKSDIKIIKNQLNNIQNDFTKFKQIQDLSNIETIIITISFALLIFGLSILANPSANAFWKLGSSTILLFSINTVYLFLGTFLSKNISSRIHTIETIILISSYYIIAFGLLAGAIFILSNDMVQTILDLLDVSNPQPITVLIIFEAWSIFMFYWDNTFLPHFENVRFSLIYEPVDVNNKTIKNSLKGFKNIINWIFKRNFLYTTFFFYVFLVCWSLILREYFQIIVIIVIAVGNSYLIARYNKKIKEVKK